MEYIFTGVDSNKQIMKGEFPGDDWIVEGLIPVGLTILAAKPKTGKGLLALQLIASVKSGEPAFDCFPVLKRGEAMYIPANDSIGLIDKRVQRLYGEGLTGNSFLGCRLSTNDGDVDGYTSWKHKDLMLARLERVVKEKPALKIVVIDPIQAVWPEEFPMYGPELYNNQVVGKVLGELRLFAYKHHIAIVCTAFCKDTTGDDLNEIYVAAEMSGAVDEVIRYTGGMGGRIKNEGFIFAQNYNCQILPMRIKATWDQTTLRCKMKVIDKEWNQYSDTDM